MVDIAYLKSMAPELASETDERLNLYLGFAQLTINTSVWRDKADMGTALLACHMITMGNRQGSGGAIASESVGGISVSYSTTQGKDGELSSTSYGSLYLQMRKTLVITPMIV
jgi:hypothetical protein